MEIILFTDGSSTVFQDSNKLKYGGIGIYSSTFPNIEISKGYKNIDITNQKMELKACIKGIEAIYDYMLENHFGTTWNLIIYTDSKYVINSITEYASIWILYGWKRKEKNKFVNVVNLNLIKKLYILYKTLPVTFRHVKSHKKQPSIDTPEYKLWYGNKKVDTLAKNSMNAIKNNN